MTDRDEPPGADHITRLGGALGNKMIREISRFHPPSARFIQDSVAALEALDDLDGRCEEAAE